MIEQDTGASEHPVSVGADPPSAIARAWTAIRFPVALFGSVAVVLYTTVAVAYRYLGLHDDYPIREPIVFPGDAVLEGWVRFDGGWYHSIVTIGYFSKPGGQSSIAFFPGYPLLMAAVSRVIGDVYLAGIVVTLVCGLAAAIVFYRWCSARSSPQKARTALALMLVFPYAWYLYGAVYADALFVLGALGAFYLLEKDRPVLAGLVAAVATATRPVGIAMVVGLVAVLLERRQIIVIPWFDRVRERGWRRSWRATPEELGGAPDARPLDVETTSPVGVAVAATRTGTDRDLRVRSDPESVTAVAPRTRHLLGLEITLGRLRPADAGVLLSLGGLLAWLGYLWASFGDPALFVEVQSAPGWDQGQGPSTWFKHAWIDRLSDFPGHVKGGPATWTVMIYTLGATFQALLVLVFLVTIPSVVKRIGWGYAAYVLALIAIPVLGSKDWQGTGRYILGAFPVFLAIAGWMIDGDHVWIRRAWLTASSITLVVLTGAYARGYYLA